MKKILVVDDDPDILEALNLTLELGGYESMLISKAEQVTSTIKEFKPDLILLDVLLSGSDGRTICRRLKTDTQTQKLPVIMLSAHPEAAKTIREYGADYFLAKPFEIDELFSTIERYTP